PREHGRFRSATIGARYGEIGARRGGAPNGRWPWRRSPWRDRALQPRRQRSRLRQLWRKWPRLRDRGAAASMLETMCFERFYFQIRPTHNLVHQYERNRSVGGKNDRTQTFREGGRCPARLAGDKAPFLLRRLFRPAPPGLGGPARLEQRRYR